MRIPTGGSRLAAGIAAVALLGLATEAAVEDVAPAERATSSAERFESDTFFCAGPSPITNADGDVVAPAAGNVWVGTAGSPARVAFEPHEEEPVEVRADGALARTAFRRAVDVAAYDGEIAAGVTQWVGDPALGVGATACSRIASDLWYFAQGSSVNDVIEHIVLYNPFPDPANVRVTAHRRGGSNVVSSLSDTEVPPKGSAVVDFTKALGPEPGDVGVSIEAERGRVVAWRSMTVRLADQPFGVELALGATAPATTLYLPAGQQTDTTRTSIVIMNPGETEASVRLSLLTGRRPLVPPGLGELAIPPGAAQRVPLDVALEGQRIPETFSVVVDSTAPVVAERTITSADEQGGRSAEVAARSGATDWLLLPLAMETANDRIVVMNPGEESVDVTLTLSPTEGPAFSPERFSVTIAGRRRVELPLGNWSGRAPFAVRVAASGAVVAERSAYATGRQDLVSAIGIPLSAGDAP